MIFWDEPKPKPKPKRKRLGKTEWALVLKDYGHRCVLCGISEVRAGGLVQTHMVPVARGGTQVRPMCQTCHAKHDRGKLSAAEQRKLGYTPQMYKRVQPPRNKRKKKSDDWPF